MNNLENNISDNIKDIHNRLQKKDWLQIEVITEYHEMLGGKIRLFSVDLKYSCKLSDEEKLMLEKSKNEIIYNTEFYEQNELIKYVANYYSVSEKNVSIVDGVTTKDHFD